MEDMPALPSVEPASGHEQHDALLVSQLAMSDALDDGQRRVAEQLVMTCHACALLAADTRAIARAVAFEPVPSRRRDFRISPDEAAALRGSAVTRFLGRLSLPQARSFAPAAAGVLSLGLAFMVAGSVWPDERIESPSGGASTVQRVAPAATTLETTTEELSVDPGLLTPPMGAAEVQADASVPAVADDAFEMGAQPDAAAKTFPEDAVASQRALREVALTSPEAELFVAAAPADGDGVGEVADALAEGEAVGPMLATATDSETGPERILLALGLLLAAVGAALLLLSWLARRAADPLLR